LLPLLIGGCAMVSTYHKGRRALGRGEYDTAIFLFERALNVSPVNPRILTDLGVAHFKKGELERATEYLRQAKTIDRLYGKAYLYMGMVYEKQDDLPKAISEYNSYHQLSPYTPMGLKLKARMGVLMRKQIVKEVRAAIEKERTLSVDNLPENSIAVSYFSNHTGKGEYDVLRKGLASMLITDLSQVKSLKVLERQRMQVLMDELKLGEAGLTDASTAPRLGRLLGARRIVSGTLALPQARMFRMDALAVDVVTAESDAKADAMGDEDRFFLMEKELVFDILGDLNVEITQAERDAIQKLPTESFLAFLAYSRGLDYEDRGMYREAAGEYQKAVKLDPGFSQASEKSQEAQTLVESPMTGSVSEIAELEAEVVAEKEPLAPDGMGISNSSRQEVMGESTAGGFLPSPDEGEQADDRTPPQPQTRTTVTVTVDLE